MLNQIVRNWFRPTLGQTSESRRQRLAPRKKVNLRRRPQFEQLEDRVVPSNMGTLHLTDITATTVEKTHYDAKTDVYAYGNNLVDGFYDVEVVAPGGKGPNADLILGLSDPTLPVQVSGGHFVAGPGLVTGPRGTAFNVWSEVISTGNTNGTPAAGSTGYDDTQNAGGEYQVVIAQHVAGETQDNFFEETGNNAVTKSKNFKVAEALTTDNTNIVTTYVITTPGGQTISGPSTPPDPVVSAPLGSTVTDTATVTDTSNGANTPAGFADFQLSLNGTVIDDSGDVALVGGSASFSFTETLGAGSYNIAASFTDGTQFSESESADEPFTILPSTIGHGLSFSTTVSNTTPAETDTVFDTVQMSTTTAGFPVTGTVTYKLYDSSNNLLQTLNTDTLDSSDTAGTGIVTVDNSTTIQLQEGSYYFVATYVSNTANYVGGDSQQEPFTVSDVPPTISSSPVHFCEGDKATNTGSFSDFDDAVTVTETSGPGSVGQTGTGVGTAGTWSWSASGLVPGAYTVSLLATNADGSTATTSFAVTVGNETPSVTSISVTPNPAQIGQTVTLSGNWNDPGTGLTPLETYVGTVTWGDSTSTTFTPNNAGTFSGITHSYSTSGTFTISVSISDGGTQDSLCPGGTTQSTTVTVLGRQNGLTLGFYSNSNGQKLLTGSTTGTTLNGDVYNALFGIAGVTYKGITPTTNGVLVKPGSTTLSVLVTGNSTGSYLTLANLKNYSTVKAELANGATATNMAYMLSAQLLTTEFNVFYGKVNATKSIFVPDVTLPSTGAHMSATLQNALNTKPTVNSVAANPWTQVSFGGVAGIQAILDASIAQLIANPTTVVSSGNRTYQEALKDCLDGINNNEDIFLP